MKNITKVSSRKKRAKNGDGVVAIILAAGRGRRMGELGKNTPKCLLRVGGKPILHWQIEGLHHAGIEKITVVTGFKESMIKKYIKDSFPSLRISFVRNENGENTNTFYSLACAAEKIKRASAVLLLNADVVFDKAIIRGLLSEDSAKSHIAFKRTTCGEEEIKIRFANDGTVSALNKKIRPREAIGEAIGINKFSRDVWGTLSQILKAKKEECRNDYFERAIEYTIERGVKISPFDIGTFRAVEVDFPPDFSAAQKLFSPHIA